MDFVDKHPKPYQRIWAAGYTDAKVEVFEIRTMDKAQNGPYYPYWRKELPLGMALSEFLYARVGALDPHLEQMQEHIEAINQGQDVEEHFWALFDMARFWLQQSPLFAPFAAAIERLNLVYERGDKLTLGEIKAQAAYYKALQPRLQNLAHTFFESDYDGPMTMKERYVDLWKGDQENYPQLQFGEIQMQEVWTGGSPFSAYDSPQYILANAYLKDTPQVFVTRDVLCTQQPRDLVDFILNRYMEANMGLRICKYCGRYFGAKRTSKGEYCDRLIDGSTKTCKEAGSIRLYEKRKFEIPTIKEYKRSYKAHNARIRYGLMTREEFDAWSAEARAKRDLCLQDKLSLEDFVAWLDSDKL